MNQHDYEARSGELLSRSAEIEQAKRPGYTLGNVDVLHNFKAVAVRAGITPEQAWLVYFLKHVDAVTSIMGRPDLPVSEEPIGRFADALNYLKLGWALLGERSAIQNPEPVDGRSAE